MSGMKGLVFSAFCLSALAAVDAAAQPAGAPDSSRLNVKTLNFDLWCQETQKLPPERCDKRMPEDEKDFEAYRAKVEKYEVPYLLEKQNEGTFNRTILHNDPENPVDHPQQQPAPNP